MRYASISKFVKDGLASQNLILRAIQLLLEGLNATRSRIYFV